MERATAIMDALRRRAYGWKSPEAQIAEALAAVRAEALEEAAELLDADHRYESAKMVRALAARGRG